MKVKLRSDFTEVSRKLLDKWIESGGNISAEEFIQAVPEILPGNIAAFAHVNGDIRTLRRWRLPVWEGVDPTLLLLKWLSNLRVAGDRVLRPFSVRTYCEDERSRVVFEAMIIPHRDDSWRLAVMDVRLVLPHVRSGMLMDDVDRSIIQHLFHGLSMKEIGLCLHLSHRTIEHRLEKLKSAFRARTIPQMVAHVISHGLILDGCYQDTQ